MCDVKLVRFQQFSLLLQSNPECENLIRRMLVVDPSKRISLEQIKQHCWLKAEPIAAYQALFNPSESERHYHAKGFNEQVLSLMQKLGIDKRRTTDVSLGHFVCASS